MVGPQDISAAFSGIGGSILPQLLRWSGYVLISAAIISVLWGAYLYFQFSISVDVFPLYGSGKDGIFSVAKKKRNRLRWVKNKTAWNSLFPLFNKKEIEPFDSEYIYPGNQVYVFDLNGRWIPGRININKSEDQIRAEINPVPYSVRNWEALMYKKHAEEYATQNFWLQNKEFFMVIATALLCLIMVGLTVWLTFQYAGGKAESIASLSNAINNFGVIKGVAPG